MRYTSRRSVEYDLEQHYILKEHYQKKCSELSEYEGIRIKEINRKKTRTFYSLKKPGDSRFQYAGDASNPVIQLTREYSYYKEMLRTIVSNINAMEQFLSVYKQTNADCVNELLPRVYRLPREDVLLKLEPEVSQWLSEKNRVKEKHPVFNPAGLTTKAFDGTLMRSRAECIHYEAFYIYDIPCVFELPYEIGEDVLSPDFTVLDVFMMEPKVFEHLGNWFHKDVAKRKTYRADSIDRWDKLGKIGFYPEVNLLLTYGAGDSSFDAQAIHRKIAMLASPPPSIETIEMLRRL